jgi:type VI protein secretion system component VasK
MVAIARLLQSLPVLRQPPKNKHLLAAIAAAAAMSTLICLGLLFGENANKRRVNALAARLDALARESATHASQASLQELTRRMDQIERQLHALGEKDARREQELDELRTDLRAEIAKLHKNE